LEVLLRRRALRKESPRRRGWRRAAEHSGHRKTRHEKSSEHDRASIKPLPPVAPSSTIRWVDRNRSASLRESGSRRFGGPIDIRRRSERRHAGAAPGGRRGHSRRFSMKLVWSQSSRRAYDRPRSLLLVSVLCIFLGGVVVGAGGRDLAEAPRPVR